MIISIDSNFGIFPKFKKNILLAGSFFFCLFPLFSQTCPFGSPTTDPALGNNAMIADVKMDGSPVSGGKLAAFVGQDLRGIADITFIAAFNKAISQMAIKANPTEKVRFEICDAVNTNFIIKEELIIQSGITEYGTSIADSFSLNTIDNTPPAIQSITSTNNNASYNAGKSINVTINFNEATTLVGGPLIVELESGTTDVTVSFSAFTSQTSISGDFNVLSGFTSADLNVNGITFTGMVKDDTGNEVPGTSLSIPGGENLADNKDIVIDTTVPTILSITSTSGTGPFVAGNTINVTVTFSEAVMQDPTVMNPANPELMVTLETGSADAIVAIPVTTTPSNVWSNNYTVAPGHESLDLDAIAINHSASLIDAAGNAAVIALSESTETIADNSQIVVDAIRPVITSILSPPVLGGLMIGESANVEISFSENVTLANGGTLDITLNTGGGGQININSISNSSSATGIYTVAANQNTTGLNAIVVALSGGGTLKDGVGNDADLTLPATNIATGSSIVVDTIIPTIDSVTSTTVNGVYTVGSSIDFTVTFSEPVKLEGGSLKVIFETGDTDAEVVKTDFDFTEMIMGSYAIQAGDNSDDLAVKEFVLASTLKDPAGNDVNLALPSSDNLADKTIVIDAIKPVITESQTFSVDENASATSDVTGGVVLVTDNRITAGNFSDFTIASASAPGFVIDPDTGQISVGPADLDLETVQSTTVTLGITASDGVNTSDEVNVTINLNPVNDAPVANSQQISIIPPDVTTDLFKRITLVGDDSKDTNGGIETFIIAGLPDAAIGFITDDVTGSNGGELAVGSELTAVSNQAVIRFYPATTNPLPINSTSFQFNVEDNGKDINQLAKLTSTSPGTVMVIFNLAPNKPASVAVTSNPSDAFVGAVLTATVTPNSTFDQDTIGGETNHVFVWKKDGVEEGRTNAFDGVISTIGKSSADDAKADIVKLVTQGNWTCEVFANDGISNSAMPAVSSPAIIVQNSKPAIAGEVSINADPDPAVFASKLSVDLGRAVISDPDPEDSIVNTFNVRIENLSTAGMLSGLSCNPNGGVPFAPGVWAVHTVDNPIFDSGNPDFNEGLEELAEDGNTADLRTALSTKAGVSSSNGFGSTGPGGVTEFMITASPGDKLSFATMFVPSNDLFYAPDDNGIALFNGMMPFNGEVTSVQLWDAGTEEDQTPGDGDQQVQCQGDTSTPDNDNNVRLASTNSFTYPDIETVIRVTIRPVNLFNVKIENLSTTATLAQSACDPGGNPAGGVPFAPGVWAVHTTGKPIFENGSPEFDEGLEALAEDGVTSILAGALTTNADVRSSNEFSSTGPGGVTQFTIAASPGDKLSLATMFVPSNDLFYSPGENGIDLFPGSVPFNGKVNSIQLWDAGTEEDQTPGDGDQQVQCQGTATSSPEDDDDNNVRLASTNTFTYPDIETVIKVSITPVTVSVSWWKQMGGSGDFTRIDGETGLMLVNRFAETDVIKVQVKAIDSGNFESDDVLESAAVAIGNTAPTISGDVVITPADPVFDSMLMANTDETIKDDVDDIDTTLFTYKWEINPDGNSTFMDIDTDNGDATLTFGELPGNPPPPKFKRGDVFKVIVRSNDRTVDSFSSVETTAVIGNTAPAGADATVIVSTGLEKMFTLAGSDSDMDPLTFSDNSDLALTGGTLKGGEVITVNANGSASFTPGSATDGDVYTFTYKINDTVEDSIAKTITLEVNDNLPPELVASAPPVPDPAMTIVGKPEGDTFSFSVTATDSMDPSNTGSIIDIEWLVDGMSRETDTNTSDVNFSAAFDWSTNSDTIANVGGSRPRVKPFMITARITDNQGGTTDVSWKVDLNDVDRVASAPGVSISPASPKTTTPLMANVDSVSTDPDGDVITGYEHTWENLTTQAAAVTGIDLAADEFKKGETVKLTSKALTNPYNEGNPIVSTQSGTREVTIGDTVVTANAQPNVQMNEDNEGDDDGVAGLQIMLTGTDPDVVDGVDSNVFAIVTPPANGTLSGLDTVTGAITYNPTLNFFNADTFTFSVTAGGETAMASVDIAIAAVNDAPVANDDEIAVTPGGTVTMVIGGATSIRDNDSDVDNPLDTLDVSIEASTQFETDFSLSADGTFSYTHDGDISHFQDQFTYRLSDDLSFSDIATVRIFLNQLPVVQNTPLEFFVFKGEHTDLSNISVGTIQAIDPDVGDSVSYSVTNDPSNLFSINASSGELTLAGSQADFNAIPSFLTLTIEAVDNGNPPQKDTATVTVFLNEARPAKIWVDAKYGTLATGTAVDFPFTAVGAGTLEIGYDAFTIIQSGIDRAGILKVVDVNVNGGTYNESVAINHSGLVLTGDLPVADPARSVIRGTGINPPKLDGANMIGNRAIWLGSNVSRVTIQGFEIANYPGNANSPSYGIHTMNTGTALIQLLNNHIHDIYVGISAGSDNGSLHDKWTVRDTIIHDVFTAIKLENVPNTRISSNTITPNLSEAVTLPGHVPTR